MVSSKSMKDEQSSAILCVYVCVVRVHACVCGGKDNSRLAKYFHSFDYIRIILHLLYSLSRVIIARVRIIDQI